MTDYDKMLIDLLNDKIKQWEHKGNEQRKEINLLKAEIRELKKGVNTVGAFRLAIVVIKGALSEYETALKNLKKIKNNKFSSFSQINEARRKVLLLEDLLRSKEYEIYSLGDIDFDDIIKKMRREFL